MFLIMENMKEIFFASYALIYLQNEYSMKTLMTNYLVIFLIQLKKQD